MDSAFGDCGLPPITEQTDMEQMDSGNSMVEFEQFLPLDSDFSERAAMSALGVAKSENVDTFASFFPPAKETRSVREKRVSIAEKIIPNQEIITISEDHHSEDSISGTSEVNSLRNGFNVAMYSQDDFFRTDTMTSMPTSQGGKRQRGFAGEYTTSNDSELNFKSFRLGINQSTGFIRHASFPTSGEGVNMDSNPDDRYVQMRLRAKRGCATHPRSIAERVRRTGISERMKKLQDLVPGMEKTTNTATMLDETMDYVMSLQNKVTELQESIVQLKPGATLINSS